MLIYELDSSAARYAAENLVMHTARFSWARSLAMQLFGCDPTAGTVIVVQTGR
jgi:hypothetical protein